MPFYDFKCSSTEQEYEKNVKYDDLESYIAGVCPICGQNDISRIPHGIRIADPVRIGVRKVPQGFKEGVLDRMKHSIPKNTLKNKY